ncbi:hypothetical protein [Thalassotalea maritima]|uniref:hypothetical protein n=1 Tax=Thalassotalea maritima TaxID=3242416 RepID=UPI00352888C4
MKNIILAMVLTLCTTSFASASDSCSLAVSDNGADIKIYNKEGLYLGYVSPNRDGSWFVWIAGKGALNEQFADREWAISTVCSSHTPNEDPEH